MSLSLDDVGQMQEAAPFGCPSLPPRFKTADGSLCARQGSALGSSKQLAQLSATAVRKPPSTFSAVGFDRHSMPTLHSNIVPLQGLGRGHNGSKRLYNSLSDNSRRAASAQLDSQKAACSVCNITAQGHGSGSSTGLLHGDSQQHQQQQQQQQQHAAPSAPSTGLWTQTSRLARLVSFPVRVTRAYYSYVPLGQQLYLNPQSVTTSIQDLGQSLASNGYLPSAAAAAEAASPPSTLPAAILSASKQQPATASVSDGVSEVVDSVVLQRREQLGRLWMHRMPTYRARFQQILFGALGEALPLALPTHGPQASRFHGDSGRQGRPIAPHIRVRRAEACAGSLLASHHLTDMLKVSFPPPALPVMLIAVVVVMKASGLQSCLQMEALGPLLHASCSLLACISSPAKCPNCQLRQYMSASPSVCTSGNLASTAVLLQVLLIRYNGMRACRAVSVLWPSKAASAGSGCGLVRGPPSAQGCFRNSRISLYK